MKSLTEQELKSAQAEFEAAGLPHIELYGRIYKANKRLKELTAMTSPFDYRSRELAEICAELDEAEELAKALFVQAGRQELRRKTADVEGAGIT